MVSEKENIDVNKQDTFRSSSNAERAKIIALRNQQNFCADCFSPDPEWCSTNLGIFICVACCGIHRHLGTHVSRVKSIKLDQWTPSMIQEMELTSNEISNGRYLKYKPQPFKNIDSSDPIYIREEIIVEKYVRKEYIVDKNWAPFIVGTVLKRGKYHGKWSQRFFRLTNNSLVYYLSQNNIEEELGRIQVDKVCIADAKTGKKFTLQVIGTDGRSIFMGFANATDLLQWLNLLRLAKACSTGLEHGPVRAQSLKKILEYEKNLAAALIIEGSLKYSNHQVDEKQQSTWKIFKKASDGWLQLHAMLTFDFLYLLKHPMDRYPVEIISLHDAEIQKISETDFNIVLPETTHYLKADWATAQRWMHAFLKTK